MRILYGCHVKKRAQNRLGKRSTSSTKKINRGGGGIVSFFYPYYPEEEQNRPERKQKYAEWKKNGPKTLHCCPVVPEDCFPEHFCKTVHIFVDVVARTQAISHHVSHDGPPQILLVEAAPPSVIDLLTYTAHTIACARVCVCSASNTAVTPVSMPIFSRYGRFIYSFLLEVPGMGPYAPNPASFEFLWVVLAVKSEYDSESALPMCFRLFLAH